MRDIVARPPFLEPPIVVGDPTGGAVVAGLVDRLAPRVERREGESRGHAFLELHRAGMEAAVSEIAVEQHAPELRIRFEVLRCLPDPLELHGVVGDIERNGVDVPAV